MNQPRQRHESCRYYQPAHAHACGAADSVPGRRAGATASTRRGRAAITPGDV